MSKSQDQNTSQASSLDISDIMQNAINGLITYFESNAVLKEYAKYIDQSLTPSAIASMFANHVGWTKAAGVVARLHNKLRGRSVPERGSFLPNLRSRGSRVTRSTLTPVWTCFAHTALTGR